MRLDPMTADDQPRLTLTLKPPAPAQALAEVSIDATFANAGSTQLRLFPHFEPEAVFFSARLEASDGTPLVLGTGAKAEFPDAEPIDLAPGAAHSVRVALPALAPGVSAPAGSYSLALSYHNQYGNDCFRGWIDSVNSVPVQIEAASR